MGIQESAEELRRKRGGERVTFKDIADHLVDFGERSPEHEAAAASPRAADPPVAAGAEWGSGVPCKGLMRRREMADTHTAIANRPAWVDLSTPDPAAAREFYSKLFGWEIEVSPDPQYGGYAMAKAGGHDVAGIGPQMAPGAPPVWSVYIGTADADALAGKIEAAGGKVVVPAFDVGDQGRMAVFQDPCGAFISAWQPGGMGTFQHGEPNQFAWAELNARSIDKALPFYRQVFGWTERSQPMGEGGPPYYEFQVDGDSIAGGMEMNPMVPAEVPSHWMAYFQVSDLDATFQTALAAGAQELVPPAPYPGGRFAVLQDPQGATFGLLGA